MIYKILRQFIRDDEFEQAKLQLAESNSLLHEYRQFIDDQNQDEKEKVEPDFLFFVWTAIGVALATAAGLAQQIPRGSTKVNGLENIIWAVLTVVALLFVTTNIWFALELTLKYAKFKANSGYKVFSISLAIGVVILLLAVFMLASMAKQK